MVVKRPITLTPKVLPIRNIDKQLEGLHARLLAITNLIQSLEEYDRYRTKRFDLGTLKTA